MLAIHLGFRTGDGCLEVFGEPSVAAEPGKGIGAKRSFILNLIIQSAERCRIGAARTDERPLDVRGVRSTNPATSPCEGYE
jgi:hypothetical protein